MRGAAARLEPIEEAHRELVRLRVCELIDKANRLILYGRKNFFFPTLKEFNLSHVEAERMALCLENSEINFVR